MSTPYTITNAPYWIAISFDDGAGAMKMGATPTTSAGQYFMSLYEASYGNILVGVETLLGLLFPLGISLYVDDGQPFVEDVDIDAYFMDDEYNQEQINSITLTSTQSLTLLPVTVNLGTDSTSQTSTLTAIVNNDTLINTTAFTSALAASSEIYYVDPVTNAPYTFTAAELDNMGLTGTFQIVLSVPYPGDADPSNNVDTLTVTRVVDNTTCDIYAQFVNNPNDRTPITTLTISETDNLTIYPLLGNNGPDSTRNSVNILIEELEKKQRIASGNIDLTGYNALEKDSSIILIGEYGYLSYAPVELDFLGLTGTFTITYIATYQGTDNVTTNDTTTLTVTRKGVGITDYAQNIAVTLFPNPAKDMLHIQSSSTIDNLTIYDISGRSIAQYKNVEKSVNISNLTSGIYLIKIQTPQGETIKKFIKE